MGKMEHESLADVLLKEFDNTEYFIDERWGISNFSV